MTIVPSVSDEIAVYMSDGVSDDFPNTSSVVHLGFIVMNSRARCAFVEACENSVFSVERTIDEPSSFAGFVLTLSMLERECLPNGVILIATRDNARARMRHDLIAFDESVS